MATVLLDQDGSWLLQPETITLIVSKVVEQPYGFK